ncbi:hypothetical protein CJD36_020760 [Flavipsychrobacter stenotrophus]|uniref:Secretion system C-terminal sorting domain-containing protein n=1 Tax=Flavipsychrobacter stenotrophus TaxID=2077091 RepID=A0A2S7SQX2_9BACT|nr:T9SS type A sorting domain-containing protein [Flavipsychrobacter stenotrophus]PQJ09015.1 hypothetical protein CJD36_020760 [Flavipsychrobacter stenotrophus]
MKVYKLIIAVFYFLLVGSAHAQIITTVAGNGMGGGPLGDGGAATAARLGLLASIAFDTTGNMYIADGNNHRIRKVDVATNIITTIAGTGVAGYNGDGILATNAQLNVPAYIAVDRLNHLYICEGGNVRIRKVDLNTGLISTFLGTGILGYSPDGTLATAANISTGIIALDTSNNLYFVDSGAGAYIRKVGITGMLETVGGIGVVGYSGNGGPATNAKIQAGGVCANRRGDIYFTDRSASIRKIDIITGIVTRVAGTGDSIETPYIDGIAATATHIGAFNVAVDDSNNLYIADFRNQRIEKVGTDGIIHSIAETGASGFSGDNNPATAAQISYPEGVALDECNNVYVVDFNNKRIRKITYPHTPTVTISAVTTTAIGSTVTINANISGAGRHYSIKWYNKGVLFNTTSVPTVSYTKTMVADSITAKVFGCSDSSLSQQLVVWDTHLGVGSVGQGGVSVFPNPVRDVLYVSGVRESARYVVSEITGRQVLCGAFQPGDNGVNVTSLSSGVYLLQLQYVNGERVVYKVMKE